MSRKGRRFDDERHLNWKKVAAVIIAVLVIAMFVVGTKELLKQSPKTNEKAFSIGYFPIYENNLWGVIDTKGNVIVQPAYEEMIIVPDNSKPIFVTMQDVNYAENTYVSKVINEKNEVLYKNYDKVELLYNKDENNNLWYETNIFKVQKDGKYGLINYDGEELLACTQDNIEVIPGTKSVYVTTTDNKKGVVDNLGHVIIDNKYEEITSLTNQYENGFIVKNEQGKYGVINYDKTVALTEKYDEVEHVYGNHMYVAKEGTILRVIDSEGKTYLDNRFDEVKYIGKDTIVIKKDGKYGVIDLQGETKIPVEYDNLVYTFSNYYIAKKGDKYGIITDKNEEKLQFTYRYISYLSNTGFMRADKENAESDLLDKELKVKATGIIAEINQNKNYIRIRKDGEYVYYNFKLEQEASTEILATNTIFLSKKNGKYGYVNDKGVVIVDYKYDDATEQNKYGYVAVKQNGKWGSLDSKGNIVEECKYTLENSIVVDFISKWHLASDINANYYTR